jgi:uncharacterized membrane protein
MSVFRDEKIWRALANFWTAVFMVFLFLNAFGHGAYDFLVVPFAFLYIGILSVFVGTKEFDRWYDRHQSRHPGEVFIAIWTAVVFVLFTMSYLKVTPYSLAHEVVAVYIAVLSIFAVTQRSKLLHEEARRRKDEKETNSGNEQTIQL